jgi:Asp-tRNA(Asn)/Glu-tRNA(Gln) amidotransferase A subunit family amidase
MRPPRLGLLRGYFDVEEESSSWRELIRILARFQAAGAAVNEIPLGPELAAAFAHHRCLMSVEAAAYHESLRAQHPADYGPCLQSLIDEGLARRGVDYARSRAHQAAFGRAIGERFGNCDVLICPATTGEAPAASSTGDPAFNSVWSYSGLPTVSLPTELGPTGLPLGIQLVGLPFLECRLFDVASWCEAVVGNG